MNKEFEALHPKVAETIRAAQDLEEIDGVNFSAEWLEVYFDESFAFQLVNKEITKYAECDLSYSPRLIEMYVDGKLAFVLFEREVVFNRFKPGTPLPLGKQGG